MSEPGVLSPDKPEIWTRHNREICELPRREGPSGGYGHAEARNGARDAGFDGYLIKPVGIKELEAELGQAGRPPAMAEEAR